MRRRAEYRLWQLPLDQPLPRSAPMGEPTVASAPVRSTDIRGSAHGSLGGYRRGCRVDELCPNWAHALITCASARRQYMRDYRERRFRDANHAFAHGTPYGYYLGCRDRRSCPGDGESGLKCADAQARRRRETAAAAGIPARVDPVCSRAASERIWELRERGLTIRSIARLTGCGRTTISELARTGSDRRSRINPETLERIVGAAVPA